MYRQRLVRKGEDMMLENKLSITDSATLAREEERISKTRAIELFDNLQSRGFEITIWAVV